MNTCVPSAPDSVLPSSKLPVHPGRLRAVLTVPVESSITPGEPTPTPRSDPDSSPAAWQASFIASVI